MTRYRKVNTLRKLPKLKFKHPIDSFPRQKEQSRHKKNLNKNKFVSNN